MGKKCYFSRLLESGVYHYACGIISPNMYYKNVSISFIQSAPGKIAAHPTLSWESGEGGGGLWLSVR